jgi:hypothetical protein
MRQDEYWRESRRDGNFKSQQRENMLDAETCESGLTHRLESIHLLSPVLTSEMGVQAAVVGGMTSAAVSEMLAQEVQFKILSRVLDFLAANSGSLPTKEVLLASLSKAIDAVFVSVNKPLISAILKPLIKAQILTIVGNLYDRIVPPAIVV